MVRLSLSKRARSGPQCAAAEAESAGVRKSGLGPGSTLSFSSSSIFLKAPGHAQRLHQTPPACVRQRIHLSRILEDRVNLFSWSEAAYSLPALEELEAWKVRFTVDNETQDSVGIGGRGLADWAVATVRNLPRLARLVLVKVQRLSWTRYSEGEEPDEPAFLSACPAWSQTAAAPSAVEDAVLCGLPEATEAAGRRLTVELHAARALGAGQGGTPILSPAVRPWRESARVG